MFWFNERRRRSQFSSAVLRQEEKWLEQHLAWKTVYPLDQARIRLVFVFHQHSPEMHFNDQKLKNNSILAFTFVPTFSFKSFVYSSFRIFYLKLHTHNIRMKIFKKKATSKISPFNPEFYWKWGYASGYASISSGDIILLTFSENYFM